VELVVGEGAEFGVEFQGDGDFFFGDVGVEDFEEVVFGVVYAALGGEFAKPDAEEV
jgi:hypothetical protein